MTHPFLETITDGLSDRAVATFRYNFPYVTSGRRRPDPPGLLQATVREAVVAAAEHSPLPLIAGGKSLGGRMTSMAASREPLPRVRGLVFLGFPLHAAGRPGENRAEHLLAVDLPMLFVQGTRDALATLELMRNVVGRIGSRATLHVVDGGDHSFKVLKRSGRDQAEVYDEITAAVASWARAIV